MKMIKSLLLASPLLALSMVTACSSDSTTTYPDATAVADAGGGLADATGSPDATEGAPDAAGPADAEGSPDAGPITPPSPPTLGAQIDRMGRPAVNTALTDPFDLDPAMQNAKKDAYNAASDPTMWATMFRAQFAASAAIYDALDAHCGNQLLAGTATVAGRYNGLASALVDDRLYVKTSTGGCNVYLAVEADATRLLPNPDCGGRKPSYDVIDATYSALAVGVAVPIDADTHQPCFVLGGTCHYLVGDTVNNDNPLPTPGFPFLSNPN